MALHVTIFHAAGEFLTRHAAFREARGCFPAIARRTTAQTH